MYIYGKTKALILKYIYCNLNILFCCFYFIMTTSNMSSQEYLRREIFLRRMTTQLGSHKVSCQVETLYFPCIAGKVMGIPPIIVLMMSFYSISYLLNHKNILFKTLLSDGILKFYPCMAYPWSTYLHNFPRLLGISACPYDTKLWHILQESFKNLNYLTLSQEAMLSMLFSFKIP